jgi:hypothetical protein
MSVNRAYITSLWTTGILVASSILVLAVTSAIVAYDRWPKSASVAPVDRVTVVPTPATAPVSSAAAPARTRAGGPSVATVRVTPLPAPSAGAPAPVRGPDGTPRAPHVGDPGSSTTAPAPSAPAAAPAQRSVPSEPTPRQRESSPLGDVIRGTGDTVGGALTPVSPTAGQTVTQVGDAAADVADAVAGSPPDPDGL